MKKGLLITIILIASLIIIIGIIIAVLFGVGVIKLTKEKTPITLDTFKSSMEEKGYTLINAKNQISDYNNINQVYIAISGDNTYQIEFYELSDENVAINFYNDNKSIFESSKGNNSITSNISASNYSRYYTDSSTGKYMFVSRIGKTVIYGNVDKAYKDKVKEILDELGY